MNEGDFDPASIEVFVGADVAKGDHYAQAITTAGDALFDGWSPTTKKRSPS